MSNKGEGDLITVADIKAEVARIGANIQEGAIRLIHKVRDQFSAEPDFWKRGTGISAEATEWLIDQGSRVMGIDQLGWDVPFHVHIALAKAEIRDDLLWEVHRVGIRKTYWHMEQLTNLSALPATGFTDYVLPLKLAVASEFQRHEPVLGLPPIRSAACLSAGKPFVLTNGNRHAGSSASRPTRRESGGA